METKFIVWITTFFTPVHTDNDEGKHDSAIIIENEKKNYRVVLGLNKDKELSKQYEPYYARSMDINTLVRFRDELTKLINSV